MVWLICNATLGRGRNRLLVRGINGAEWVFCPLIRSVKKDKISTDQCQACRYFILFEQRTATQTHSAGKTPYFGKHSLTGRFFSRKTRESKTIHPRTRQVPSASSFLGPREPLVDIFQEEDDITVLAELPSVNEEDIYIKADGKSLTITAENATRRYLKIVELPTTHL